MSNYTPEDLEALVHSTKATLDQVREAATALGEDPARHMRRHWNYLAFGVDDPEQMTVEGMKAMQAERADEVVREYLTAHGGRGTGTGVMSACHRAGVHKRDYPRIAAQLVLADCLSPEAAREYVVQAWKHCEYPEGNLSADLWRDVFAIVGYVTDVDEEDLAEDPDLVAQIERPTEPVRLYRGAVRARRTGMAWSANLDKARWFAQRAQVETVWTVVAPPERLLARFVQRAEDEWVVDTRGLLVEPWSPGLR